MDVRRKTFVAEACSRLGFLVEEYGFVGPEVEQRGGEYPLLIYVRYDRSDLQVEVSLVLAYMGEEYVSAGVSRKAGAEAGRHTVIAEHTAHTGFQMRRALDRHAQALREVLGEDLRR